MKLSSSIALASIVAFSLVSVGTKSSIAGPFTGLSKTLMMQVGDQPLVIEIRKDRRNYKRRRYDGRRDGGRRYGRRHQRPRQHRRYRRYRRHDDSIWYTIPFLLGPMISEPRRSSGCERWRRQCYRNWGPGPNYRGCLRYHRCM
jgi:hypothetical protein